MSGEAHAHSKPWHWIVTAAGVGAVIGVGTVIAPASAGPVSNTAQPLPSPSSSASGHLTAPKPKAADLPLDCGGVPVKIVQQFSAVLPGSHTPVTVVDAHCDSGTGTPPDGLFVLVPTGTPGKSRVGAVLITERQRMSVRKMGMLPDGSIHATVDTYSNDTVPNCCPDVHETLTWAYQNGNWTGEGVTANQASA